ncbi:MliC family protein [Oryzicola mucosus]|uniref:MliC family protein n=1 Tax=Oryzicola mucosus TaxID=2767425 RepID=A0A8J6U4P8_9HYPH|nr:MliC family protein [Oryzicola mucosus]MBD0414790.1 MliC family protein [Oryzicola mucosus]
MFLRNVTAATVLSMGLGPVSAQEVDASSIKLTLDPAANGEVISVDYRCGGAATVNVRYVNADPNTLAVIPVDGQSLIFVSTLSGSGARYVSGKYEWWSKGAEGTLRDLTQDENADPVMTCQEAGQ